MDRVRPVLRWVAQSGKRVGVTIVGFALLLAGAVMLVTPGPGIVAVIAGLAVLGSEYAWARRALDETKRRAAAAARRARRGARRRRQLGEVDPPEGQDDGGSSEGDGRPAAR